VEALEALVASETLLGATLVTFRFNNVLGARGNLTNVHACVSLPAVSLPTDISSVMLAQQMRHP
jgi:hypothetical protein